MAHLNNQSEVIAAIMANFDGEALIQQASASMEQTVVVLEDVKTSIVDILEVNQQRRTAQSEINHLTAEMV